jgi:TolB-like protein/Flp pilus assembly protein TadD
LVAPTANEGQISSGPIKLSSNSGSVVLLAEWLKDDVPQPAKAEADSEVIEMPRLRAVPAAKDRKGFVAAIVVASLILGAIGLYLFTSSSIPANSQIKIIAVLPFKTLVADPQSEMLELPMADALITKLNTIGEITVRPLSSVSKFRRVEQDPISAGNKLSVDAVVDGNIQIVDGRVRVSVKLFSTKEGRLVWSQNFDEDFSDVLKVQDNMADKIASAVIPRLSTDARARLAKHGTDSVEAWQLYVSGRLHAARLILPETEKAIADLNRAIEIDPNYALAYVELANAYRAQTLSGDLPARDVLPKSKEAALKASAIDNSLADAHVAVGHAALWYDRNWKEAEAEGKRALALEPNNAPAMYLLENLYSFVGRHDEAIEYGRKARELVPDSILYNSIEAQSLLYARHIDEALERALKARDLDDNSWHVHLTLARIYTEKGMYPEALAEADRAAELSRGHSYALAIKGFALARSGAAGEAAKLIDELSKQTERGRYHTNIALIYTGLGDATNALEHLETGFEMGELQHELRSAPQWDGLRNDPRYIDLLRKLDLE